MHAREEIYRDIIENAPDAVLFADRDGIIRVWNRSAQELFGFSEEEALGRPLEIIVPEHLRDRHNEGFNQVMETGLSQYRDRLLSVPALRKDGSRVFVEFTIVLVPGEDERPAGVAAIMREKKKEAEKHG